MPESSSARQMYNPSLRGEKKLKKARKKKK